MCQAKIVDHWSFKYKCLLPDYSIITSITTDKKGIVIKRTKTLCKKHASIHRRNMNWKVKHKQAKIEYSEKIITD